MRAHSLGNLHGLLAVANRRVGMLGQDPCQIIGSEGHLRGDGKYRAALRVLEPSLSHADRVPEIAYHARAIHAKLGNKSRGVQFLRLSLSGNRAFSGREEATALLENLTSGGKPLQ